MKCVVEFLPRAQQDLLALSEKIQDEILRKATLLQEFPRIGTPMERAFADYRFFLVAKSKLRIIYKIKNTHTVEICYIRHCRRQMTLRIV